MSVHRIVRLTALALVTAALASYSSFADAQDSLGTPSVPPPTGVPELLGPPGTWHQLATPVLNLEARHGQSAIYDPVKRRVVEFGGFRVGAGAQNDLISFDVVSPIGWTNLAAGGVAPTARFGHSAIYDPLRQRMILFGGNETPDGIPTGDLMTLSLGALPVWSTLPATGTPPGGRYGHSAIYDAPRDRMIVFGGFDGTSFLGDVWALQLSGTPTWTLLAASGGPSPRDYASAIFDPVRNRMVVFGGNDGNVYNDLWQFDLLTDTWSPLVATGTPPSPRLAHGAVYDAAADRMVVFGGAGGPGVFLNDFRQLSLGGTPAWTPLTPGGNSFPAGHSRGVALVPDFHRILIHGGVTTTSSSLIRAVDLSTPETVFTFNPGFTERDGHIAVIDPVRRRVFVQGGQAPSLRNDLFSMPLDGPGYWARPFVDGALPSARHGHSGVYDPVRDCIWTFGGYAGAGAGLGYQNDLWKLSLVPPHTWTPVTPAGPSPEPRDYASLVYDPSRDRFVLFGGNDNNTFLNDVWVLSTAGTPVWTQLTPAGTPPAPRLAHRAVWDGARDRMLVFGGYTNAPRADVWALEFSPVLQWVQLLPGGTAPAPRYSASLVLDTVRDRLLLFGGFTSGGSQQDLWELPLSSGFVWSPLTAGPTVPRERHGHTAVYDPLQDLMLVTGGFSTVINVDLLDSWVLDFGNVATATDVSLASREVTADLVRLVWSRAGGAGAATFLRRTGEGPWQRIGEARFDGTGRCTLEDRDVDAGATYTYGLDFGDGPEALVEIAVPSAARLSFAGLRPNPAGEDSRLAFVLPREGRVRVEAFDVNGRRVALEDLGTLAAGAHRVALAGLRGLPTGLYTLRLVTPSGERTARATVLR